MASIYRQSNGRKTIECWINDSRRRIRLGKATAMQADAARRAVEDIVGGGKPLPETTAWLDRLDIRIHKRIVKALPGLVKPRQTVAIPSHSFGDLHAAFFQTLNVKASTAAAYKQGADSLLAFFGESKPLAEITPLDAARWQQSQRDNGLADATVAKRTIVAKQMFARAVDWEMLAKNPFKNVKPGSQANKARIFFVSEEVSQKVLTACPSAEWRAIFALARYGGVRCPSEILPLKWADINFETNRVLITAAKTAHHKGHETRIVPLFPKLRKPLLELFSVAPEATEFVITRYRCTAANLRTQFGRILSRAGVTAWPRLFQNLRSTRANELCRSHPSHVAAAWLGHSEEVADEHYRNVTDADFDKAICELAGNAGENQGEHTSESVCNDKKSAGDANEKGPEFPSPSEQCGDLQTAGMGAPGFEPGTKGL
jgi:integrase